MGKRQKYTPGSYTRMGKVVVQLIAGVGNLQTGQEADTGPINSKNACTRNLYVRIFPIGHRAKEKEIDLAQRDACPNRE